jgi:hypothetical protein
MRTLESLIGGLIFLALLPPCIAQAASENSCLAIQARLERTIALISKLPGPEQTRQLDAFQYAHEDPERCSTDRLLEVQNQIERPLIVLDADGVKIEPDKIYRCAVLQRPQRSCNGAYADDTLFVDERLAAGPSMAPAKRCSLRVRWPEAKLIDLYFLSPTTKRQQISTQDGAFDCPPTGTSLVALFQVGGHMKLRKLVWEVH